MEVTQMFSKTFKAAMMALAGFAVAAAIMPREARADWLADLFGDSSGNFNSREMVRFSPKFEPGQIVISFGDRRLYYVQQRGTAISYPIAIPKGDARWSGISKVS